MGDRGNIVVRDQWLRDGGPGEAVFLYSHWGGMELPEVLRRALDKRWRWDDGSYLARIIFEEMIDGDRGGETGYGIGTRIMDNEYDLLVLHEQRVYRMPESAYTGLGFANLEDCESIGFAEYIASAERTWDNLLDAA
jgi:hypothetical protein